MSKKLIRLTEQDLNNIVKLSVNKILTEQNRNLETYYRGYNSKYGSQHDHMLWITEDISYARAYGNRVEEIIIDTTKLKLASLYEIDEIVGYECDPYDGLEEDDANLVLAEGYNGYGFDANSGDSYCLCLFSNEPIVSRRELTREEFENIELYDDLDYQSYE